MQVPIETVQETLTAAAHKFVTEPEARYFARLCLASHLKKAPRMKPLAEAVADLKVWQAHDRRQVQIVADKPGALVLNFNGLAPSLKIRQVHDELERRARDNGIAAVGFYNSAGVVTLNMWADGLAQRNLIGVSMFNGGTECCVPHGGRRGVMGTNPLAYAIPTADEPLALDMATTEIPFFDVRNAKADGMPLPTGAAVDGSGRPTTLAADALSDDGVANLLPIGGGFKGYGLVCLIEVLTGSLVRSLLSHEQTSGWHPPEYGCLTLAIDVASFTESDRFKQAVSDLAAHLRAQPPAEGSPAVSVPGDRGHAKVADAMAAGVVDMADGTWEDLRQMAV